MPTSAVTRSNIVFGAHSYFAYAPYVAAKAAGTFVDAGGTEKGVGITQKTTYHEVILDQNLGAVSMFPTKREMEIDMVFGEATMANLQAVLGLPTGALVTGVLKWNPSAPEIYYQLELISPGIVGKNRTGFFWRCVPTDVTKMEIKKDGELLFGTKWKVCEEIDTGSLDNFGKITEA